MTVAGHIARLVAYGFGVLAFWHYAPFDLAQKPLASLSVLDLFGLISAVAAGAALGYLLLHPSRDPIDHRAWDIAGKVMIALAVLGAIYAASH